MRDPARILVVDDTPANREILETRLISQGYEVLVAKDGEEALAIAQQSTPDLVLLDVMMPGKDGFEVCRELKSDSTLPFMPIILVTAKSESKDIVAGLDAGGDEYITKPVDQAALVARVRSILRMKSLHDQVQEQAAQLENWNSTLEQRVSNQLTKIERLSELQRFLPQQVAELVLSSGGEQMLVSHRRNIAVVFGDLRGFTAFSEISEPEEVMKVLGEYHEALGDLIVRYEGTLERFAGDGLMVLFNDPLPCPEPTLQAVRMAMEMCECVGELSEGWRKQGHELGFGVGIAEGYATLGTVGFRGRFEYSAIGSVTNLASRLCDEAGDGEILLSQRAFAAVEGSIQTEAARDLILKGFTRPMPAWRVTLAKT